MPTKNWTWDWISLQAKIKLYSMNFSLSFFLFSRYGIHVTYNGYYLCYDVDMIKKIFEDIRTIDKGEVCLVVYECRAPGTAMTLMFPRIVPRGPVFFSIFFEIQIKTNVSLVNVEK